MARPLIVLDGNQAPPTQKGAQQPPPLFGPCLLRPNDWMDQGATGYGGRPWHRPHCVRLGRSSPRSKTGDGHSPQFSAHVCWPNGWTHQGATWYGRMPRSRRHCVGWGTQLHPKRDTAPHFSAHVYCGQTVAHLSYC